MNEKEIAKRLGSLGSYPPLDIFKGRFWAWLRPGHRYEIFGTSQEPLVMKGKKFNCYTIANRHVRLADFSEASLEHTWIENCIFENVCFDHADLSQMSDLGNSFKNCTFVGTSFVEAGIGYDGSSYDNCKFNQANFRRAVFARAEFNNSRFINCKLKGVDFNASSFVDCEFTGKLEDVWFRGGFAFDGDIREFGVPRKNTMANVSFKNASFWWGNFTNGCDLSSIILPSEGSYRLYTDWKNRLEALKQKVEEWPPEERAKANIFVESYLVHASDQYWFLLNLDDIVEYYGNRLAGKIIDTLDHYDSKNSKD